jgi:microcin C transport system substrate-binding protein
MLFTHSHRSRRPLLAAFIGVVAATLLAVSGAPAEEPRVTVSHGITLGDELKYPEAFTHFDYVNPDAPKGGALRDYATNGFDSFNPFILKGKPPAGIDLVHDSLMVSSEDDPMALYGLVAESVEYPDDLSYVTFNLRREARFQDGSPITADDVIFSFTTLRDHGFPGYRLVLRGVAKVEKLGPYRVRFDFREGEVDRRDRVLIVGRLPVLSKTYWEHRDFEADTLIPPVGSGPYRIVYFEPNRFIVYSRVRDYWAKDLPVRRGQYNFDYIRYDYFLDENVALEAFKTGAYYDFRIETSAKTWETGYGFPATRAGDVVREEVPTKEPLGMQGFAFNLRRDKFADIRVRKAIALAFDFDWVNQHLFYGRYTRNDSFFANSDLAATGTPTQEEIALLEPWRGRIPDAAFGEAFKSSRAAASGSMRDNLAEAARLLHEAGWVVQRGKLVNPKTRKPFTLEFLLTASEFERVILPFIAHLQRLGIAARINTVDAAQYITRMQSFDFEMVVATFPESLSPGIEQRLFWSSPEADKRGGGNVIGIKSPAVDALVERIVSAPDRKTAAVATRALDRVLTHSYYVVPQWYLDKYWIAYWDRFGMPATRPAYGIGLSTWWYDPAKNARARPRPSG